MCERGVYVQGQEGGHRSGDEEGAEGRTGRVSLLFISHNICVFREGYLCVSRIFEGKKRMPLEWGRVEIQE